MLCKNSCKTKKHLCKNLQYSKITGSRFRLKTFNDDRSNLRNINQELLL